MTVRQSLSNTNIVTEFPESETTDVLDSTHQNPRWAMWELTKTWPYNLHLVVQAYFDWVTGYYLLSPLWKSTPWLELAYGTLQYLGGLGIVAITIKCKTLWLLPLGWWLSVAGAAQLQEVAHYCAHKVFSPNNKQEK